MRVDDRLIHGQVVVGWGRHTGARRVVLVDDAVKANEWEQELYRTGVPPEMAVEFLSIADAPGALQRLAANGEPSIVLVASIQTLVRLCDTTDLVARVNLGGVHDAAGRTQRLPYVYLTDEEVDALRRLTSRGVAVSAQDVPTASPVPLEDLA